MRYWNKSFLVRVGRPRFSREAEAAPSQAGAKAKFSIPRSLNVLFPYTTRENREQREFPCSSTFLLWLCPQTLSSFKLCLT